MFVFVWATLQTRFTTSLVSIDTSRNAAGFQAPQPFEEYQSSTVNLSSGLMTAVLPVTTCIAA